MNGNRDASFIFVYNVARFVFSCLRGEATCHQLRSLSIPGRRKLPTRDHASPATFRQLAGMRGPCLSCNSLVGRGKCSAILGRYLRAYRVSGHCTTCLLPSPPAARRGKRAAHICVLRQGIGAVHKCFQGFHRSAMQIHHCGRGSSNLLLGFRGLKFRVLEL